MNIFILDEDPDVAARHHCDKHVVKMILESAQMLSTAHWMGWAQILQLLDSMKQKQIKEALRKSVERSLQPVYSMTHVNHPCTIWTRETRKNYEWLCIHAKSLCEEYTRRYGKRHKSEDVIDWLCENVPPHLQNCDKPLTPFAQAMPDIYKADSAVVAYQSYYIGEKMRFAKWRHSHTPSWFPGTL